MKCISVYTHVYIVYSMNVYQIIIAKGELVKLKADLDEANIAHEGTLAALRQKHNNSMAELGEIICF